MSACAFPSRLLEILEREDQRIVSWNPDNVSFRVHDASKFAQEVLSRYFRHERMASFQRQLSLYGFQKTTTGHMAGSYHHPQFVRYNVSSIESMRRMANRNATRGGNGENEGPTAVCAMFDLRDICRQPLSSSPSSSQGQAPSAVHSAVVGPAPTPSDRGGPLPVQHVSSIPPSPGLPLSKALGGCEQRLNKRPNTTTQSCSDARKSHKAQPQGRTDEWLQSLGHLEGSSSASREVSKTTVRPHSADGVVVLPGHKQAPPLPHPLHLPPPPPPGSAPGSAPHHNRRGPNALPPPVSEAEAARRTPTAPAARQAGAPPPPPPAAVSGEGRRIHEVLLAVPPEALDMAAYDGASALLLEQLGAKRALCLALALLDQTRGMAGHRHMPQTHHLETAKAL